MPRTELVEQLAQLIVAVRKEHPVRVAIDGVDGAGKTMLANELTTRIRAHGRPVIRACIDGFHRPRRARYQRGQDSPEGYYLDSFDYKALRDALLLPLGPGGSLEYRQATFDYRSDSPMPAPPQKAATTSILLFDGVFLFRPELSNCWDFRVFVEVDIEEAIRRGSSRDRALFGSVEAARQRYSQRYIPGQLIYLQSVRPQDLADVVIDNTDLSDPRFLKRPTLSSTD